MDRNKYKASGFKRAGGYCWYREELPDLMILMVGTDPGICGACLCSKAVVPYSQGVIRNKEFSLQYP